VRSRRRRRKPSSVAMRAAAQVFEFMAVRLGYNTEQIYEAASIWNARVRGGEAEGKVSQIGMIEALERIIKSKRG